MSDQKRKVGFLGTLGLVMGASAAVSGLLLRRWAKSGSGELQIGGLHGKGVTLRKLENGSIVIDPARTVPADADYTSSESSTVIELREEDIAEPEASSFEFVPEAAPEEGGDAAPEA